MKKFKITNLNETPLSKFIGANAGYVKIGDTVTLLPDNDYLAKQYYITTFNETCVHIDISHLKTGPISWYIPSSWIKKTTWNEPYEG